MSDLTIDNLRIDQEEYTPQEFASEVGAHGSFEVSVVATSASIGQKLKLILSDGDVFPQEGKVLSIERIGFSTDKIVVQIIDPIAA